MIRTEPFADCLLKTPPRKIFQSDLWTDESVGREQEFETFLFDRQFIQTLKTFNSRHNYIHLAAKTVNISQPVVPQTSVCQESFFQ